MFRIKFILETIISSFLYFSGLHWLYMIIMDNGRNIPIIFYHEIGSTDKNGLTEFSVSANHFEKQIKWLSKHFNVVPIDELIKHISGEITLQGRVAAVTFDGGYAGNYQYVFPILKKYNVPATVYLVTNSVDGNIPWERTLLYLISLTEQNKLTLTYNHQRQTFGINTRNQKRAAKLKIQNYMSKLNDEEKNTLLKEISKNLNVELSGLAQKLFLSWDQIRKMNKSELITIGSHSLTHPKLTDIPSGLADREIVESKKHTENKLGERITSFCYPDGHFSEVIKMLVKNAGYSSGLAVITPKILSDLNGIGDDLFALRRICMPDRYFTPLIATELSGIMRIFKRAGKLILGKE